MGRFRRVAAAVLGVLLLYGGIYALILSAASPAWRYLGGIGFVVLGVNSLYGAFTGKEPWILRIGPLP